MEFLNPTALFGLLALPLLLVPYLLRRKPRRYMFSSVFIFAAMGADPAVRPGSRPRIPLIFFLQLLLLALMVLALSEPVLTTRPSKVAIVMDNSASMQALEDGKPRFVLAQERAAGISSDLGSSATVDLYFIAPRLARFGTGDFSIAEVLEALQGQKPIDAAEAQLDYGGALGQLAKEQEYDRIYFITDRPAQGQGGPVRVLTVGQPRPNLTITAFVVHPASLADPRLNASVEVANFSGVNAPVKITLRGDGTPLASRALSVGPGGLSGVTFEGLPQRSYYEAEIDSTDALPLDNRRFALATTSKRLRILGISPRSQELASLRAIPGIELDIIAPAQYEKADRSGYGLEIFHFAAPAVLPRNPAWFILPPDQSGLVQSLEPEADLTVTGWREGHPITRYVNFSLLRPRYARPLSPEVAAETIVQSAAGSLLFATIKNGAPYLVLGFDPFPYLGTANLPMSILTVNIIDWFFGFSGGHDQATGEPIAVNGSRFGDRIITPTGETVSLNPGATHFPAALYQGIYRLRLQGEQSFIAVNLRAIKESDLRHPEAIELRGQSDATSDKTVLLPSWSYFLLAAFVLLLLEWFINPRIAGYRFRRGASANMPSRT
jgi:Aerotolerance regulator N-terminal